MTTRSMENTFKDWTFYKSTFDLDTGTTVREVEVAEEESWWRSSSILKLQTAKLSYEGQDKYIKEWRAKYSANEFDSFREQHAFPPVPETIDIQITDWCDFGCSYCYMSSTAKGKHAPKALLETVFNGLDIAPYQIAFGGGEPTAHPDFPWFLQFTREQGTVPNYTTAGHIFREDVIEATNEYAGGVALTYHRARGLPAFLETYKKWSEALSSHTQLNIHVLFDNDVAKSLAELREALSGSKRKVSIVLLAYYPSAGRASLQGIPSKRVYMVEAPKEITACAQTKNFSMAFSEGLLPYFLSRDILPTVSAVRQEGVFSCYVSKEGIVKDSSFTYVECLEHFIANASIYSNRLQEIWQRASFIVNRGSTFADQCEGCSRHLDCHISDPHHSLICARAQHNQGYTQ